jgi:hypothetical protein
MRSIPPSLARRSGPSFDGSAHPVSDTARPSSEDRPARTSSTVLERASSTPRTRALCMKRGRKNTVGYTQSRRHWEVRGSSCVIPRRSHIFMPERHGHIYRSRSPSKHSQNPYVVDDGLRDVHVVDAQTRWGKVCYGPMEKIIGGISLIRRVPGANLLTNFTRQRKSLTPAFSSTAIRQLTPIFYDSAYKVRSPSYAS